MRVRHTILLAASAAVLAGCWGGVPSGDPAEQIGTDLRGYRARLGVMMGADEKPYWVQAALKGFREVKAGDRPAGVEQRNGIGGCAFTRPSPGDKVALVHVDGSPMRGPVFAFDRTDVGKRAELMVEHYKRNGKANATSDAGADQLQVVDVAVTERSRPVHLVLASNGSPLLFNIHLAPGARVSRVAVIGAGTTGVANLDPAAPVEFLTGDAKGACGVAPMRTPADHWTFVQNARDSGGRLDELLEKNHDYARAWSSWHRGAFGVVSEPGSIGANETAHVLVGPLPASSDERARYRSLKGAAVLVSRADYVLAGTVSDYAKMNADLVRAAASEAAGGDLAGLHRDGG